MFWFRLQGQACKEDAESIFLEPISDLLSPDLNLFNVVGKTPFNAVQETLNQCASRGKDGQTDQDEEYPLKDRKEEARIPSPMKSQPMIRIPIFLNLFIIVCVFILQWTDKIKQN